MGMRVSNTQIYDFSNDEGDPHLKRMEGQKHGVRTGHFANHSKITVSSFKYFVSNPEQYTKTSFCRQDSQSSNQGFEYYCLLLYPLVIPQAPTQQKYEPKDPRPLRDVREHAYVGQQIPASYKIVILHVLQEREVGGHENRKELFTKTRRASTYGLGVYQLVKSKYQSKSSYRYMAWTTKNLRKAPDIHP